jgi:hypothetical protein
LLPLQLLCKAGVLSAETRLLFPACIQLGVTLKLEGVVILNA